MHSMVESDIQKARSRSIAAISVLTNAILSVIVHSRHNFCFNLRARCRISLHGTNSSILMQYNSDESCVEGFTTSTHVLDGGYFPDFFLQMIDPPSPIFAYSLEKPHGNSSYPPQLIKPSDQIHITHHS